MWGTSVLVGGRVSKKIVRWEGAPSCPPPRTMGNPVVKKKVSSFISFICLQIMPCSYSEMKHVIQAIFSFFGLVTATSFDILRYKIDQYV